MQKTTQTIVRDMYYRLRDMGLSIKESYEQVENMTGLTTEAIVILLEQKEEAHA